jgi:GTP-sensing pleiotropic transcriptional regulator CodY
MIFFSLEKEMNIQIISERLKKWVKFNQFIVNTRAMLLICRRIKYTTYKKEIIQHLRKEFQKLYN